MTPPSPITFSIITPTIRRSTLLKCASSVRDQTYPLREHLISPDSPPTGDFGNSARRRIFPRATGDYILYLDDDNYFAHPEALSDIHDHLRSLAFPDWALFPIDYCGSRYFHNPPSQGLVDTANLVVRREYAEWPDTPAYEADGQYAERLVRTRPYAAFPHCRPIICVPTANKGKMI